MATTTEILDQYVRDSRYGTSSKAPQAGRAKTPKISNGGTVSASRGGARMVKFKELFKRM